MYMKQIIIAVLMYYCIGVTSKPLPNIPAKDEYTDGERVISKVAFGSCNRHDEPQHMWSAVSNYKADIWLWLGDNIYADTRLRPFHWVPSPLQLMAEKYHTFKHMPDYTHFREQTDIVGVWDDHDYGHNNGDHTYVDKVQAKDLMLSFMDEPEESIRRTREGVYASYTFGPVGKRLQIVLLDVRYFQEPRDMLGEQQWTWLEHQLATSNADITLIGGGTQFLTDTLLVEKWDPQSKQRLYDIIKRTKRSGVILLSGDVHFAEVLCQNPHSVGYPLYEFTSSGITHSCGNLVFPSVGGCRFLLDWMVPASHRVGDFYEGLNFGSIDINWNSDPVAITFHAKTTNGRPKISQSFTLDQLQIRASNSTVPCQGLRRPRVMGTILSWIAKLFGTRLRRLVVLGTILTLFLFWKRTMRQSKLRKQLDNATRTSSSASSSSTDETVSKAHEE